MVFWFVRYENSRISSDGKRQKLKTLIEKMKNEVSDELEIFCYLDISPISDYCQDIFENVKANCLNIREQNDLNLLYTNVRDNAQENNIVYILFAEKSEVDEIAKYYRRQNVVTDYDILVVNVDGNQNWTEQGRIFSVIDENLDLSGNLKNLMRTTLLAEVISNSSQKENTINSISGEIMKFYTQIATLSSFLPEIKDDKDNEAQTSSIITKINQFQHKICESIDYGIEKCEEICRDLSQEKNECKFSPELLIKYPTTFNESQISLEESLSSTHDNHIFKLSNNTTFSWLNLCIYAEAKDLRICEIPILTPNEQDKIIDTDFDFDMLNELGYYSIQVFYSGQPVSKKVYVCRVKILEVFMKNEKLTMLKTKNIGQGIKACTITLIKMNDNSQKQITSNLTNYGENEMAFQNLERGKNYSFQVSKDGLNLCPPFVVCLGQ